MTVTTVPIDANPTFTVRTVSPDTAASWLKRNNSKNRNLRTGHVSQIARDIKAGKFLFNGDAIRFSTAGVLLDGQHRLAAVAEAEQPVEFLIVSGLPDDAQDTMDAGISRTTADALTIRGDVNAAVLGSIARRVWWWKTENYRFHQSVSPSRMEQLDIIIEHPEIYRSTQFACDIFRAYRGIPRSVLGTAHWLFNRIDPEETPWFMARVADGAELPASSPILTLRHRIMRDREREYKPKDHVRLAYLIRAWNAHRKDEPLSRIVQGPKDKMPMPI